uniref:Uncharacterized protein n=1 Tax=Solanum tuberosum TaxID=4113 RepID=M1DSP4_SOLTU
MNQLSNAFSLLNLDVADSQAEITNGDTDRVTGEGKEKGTDGSPGEMKVDEHQTRVQKLEPVSGECKLPLVWIDLEMTGQLWPPLPHSALWCPAILLVELFP